MHKGFCLTLLCLFHAVGYAEDVAVTSPNANSAEQAQVQYYEQGGQPSIHTLLVELNRNARQANELLQNIATATATDGCSRQLQVDTIGLVANMNRNIQVMTNIMVRMGYNIEELSRAPKKMNDLPFMP